MKDIKTIILAAGEGTRMKSDMPKVLHRVAGKTLLEHVLDTAGGVSEKENIAVIVGYKREEVEKTLPEQVSSFVQAEQNGTGHAVMCATDFFADSDATVVILNGDAPLIKPETLEAMLKQHENSDDTVTIMTAEVENPTGYGRIIKEDGKIVRIVEERDASEEERSVREINAGTYCFNADALNQALESITADNTQGEYYLTDAVEIIKKGGGEIGAFCADFSETAAVNSRSQLAETAQIFRDRINTEWMEKGVTLIDPQNTYIDTTVKIGTDTVVYPGALLEGKTIIGKDCIIGPNTHLVNAKIADNVEINNSTIYDSSIDSESVVGPYAYVRPNSIIGKDTKIGDFVEIKNSTIGDGTKISHLTYVGDADVGKNVNLGCGTVFVNYDGKKKYKTVVEDDCFIGCNVNLIAPVTVQKGAFVAAGSTITEEVPRNALAIARARQINKE